MPPILFNYLTGYSRKKTFRKLLVAPLNLRQRMEEMIQREIDIQRQRRPGPVDPQDERAGGRAHHQAALSGFASGRYNSI